MDSRNTTPSGVLSMPVILTLSRGLRASCAARRACRARRRRLSNLKLKVLTQPDKFLKPEVISVKSVRRRLRLPEGRDGAVGARQQLEAERVTARGLVERVERRRLAAVVALPPCSCSCSCARSHHPWKNTGGRNTPRLVRDKREVRARRFLCTRSHHGLALRDAGSRRKRHDQGPSNARCDAWRDLVVDVLNW